MSLLSETNAKAPVRQIGGLGHLARFCLLAGTLISGNGDESDYRAATAWIDITPQELPIRMAGSMRPSQANIIHDPLRARLILIATEKTKIILGTLDHCVLPEAVFQPIALAVDEATQIPASHITLSATHTHSAPPLTGLFLNDLDLLGLFFTDLARYDPTCQQAPGTGPYRMGFGRCPKSCIQSPMAPQRGHSTTQSIGQPHRSGPHEPGVWQPGDRSACRTC
ncbi:MAG: hypothetical protein EBU26_12205 [Verrucomicrobia bacterium]|nr:hypothetical protein [Verrucomicrobiota bacterium]